MKIDAVTIRPARPDDAVELADIHDAAWRGAYRGVLPGVDLERLLARRGVSWWHAAIRYRTRISVIEICGCRAGYASVGHSRLKTLPFSGEIYELYLRPDHQGLGFGRQLFAAARETLERAGMPGFAVRVLADNTPARGFYEAMGGRLCAETSERIGRSDLAIRVYGWPVRPDPRHDDRR